MSLKKILSCLTKADYEYNLIESGDKIAVGVSGGKDSMLLLKVLKQYSRFPNKDFEILAVFLDLGFGNVDIQTLEKYCKEIDVPLHIENSQEVYQILSHHKNEKGHLPCSICSRMKKAAINKVAHQFSCNKVAFAHHCDDALETLLMNQIYGGRIATFAPKMFLTTTSLTFIRPFILVREKDIIATCKNENIPIIKSACPNDHITMREEAKKMLQYIYNRYPESYNNFRLMLQDNEHFDLWFDKKQFPLGEGYYAKECFTQQEFFLVITIRNLVFVQEQNIDSTLEFDKEDTSNNTHFFLLFDKDKAIGTISLVQEEHAFHLRRFALLKEYRNKKLGMRLIKYVEFIYSSKVNPCIFYLNAQIHLQSYYEQLGYHPVGTPFLEAGILHIRMEKEVKNIGKLKL